MKKNAKFIRKVVSEKLQELPYSTLPSSPIANRSLSIHFHLHLSQKKKINDNSFTLNAKLWWFFSLFLYVAHLRIVLLKEVILRNRDWIIDKINKVSINHPSFILLSFDNYSFAGMLNVLNIKAFIQKDKSGSSGGKYWNFEENYVLTVTKSTNFSYGFNILRNAN